MQPHGTLEELLTVCLVVERVLLCGKVLMKVKLGLIFHHTQGCQMVFGESVV